MKPRAKGAPLRRHTEAELARSLGTSPVVELKGHVRLRAGRVIGIFLGPNDMAEMLRCDDFKHAIGREEGCTVVGHLHGTAFYLLEDDLE